MDTQNVSVVLSFAAGILSFISPCVLPLVPAYIGYLSGRAVNRAVPSRAVTFGHAMAFVAGFTIVFTVIFGLAAGMLSETFSTYLDFLRRAGGIVVIVLGLHLLGIIHISFLDYDRRLGNSSIVRQPGYLTSIIVGMSFAAGWTPCVGPMLSAIFSLALNEGQIAHSLGLFFVYSMGLGVPFLLTALALESMTARLKSLNRYLGLIERVAGLLLVLIGVLLLLDVVAQLSRYFQWVPPI